MADERGDEERVERSARRALPIFNGKSTSFPVWKARVRAWLQAESPPLLYVLDGVNMVSQTQDAQQQSASSSASSSAGAAVGKAAKKKEERLEMDRQRVYNALISALDDAHVGIIVTEVAEGDALGAWKILLRKYERNTAASRNQLRRELHTLKLSNLESVDEYKARALYIAARLRATKEVVSDGEVLYCVLEGLPAAYEMVRQALEVQDIVDLEAACSHLREVEDKIRRRTVGMATSSQPPVKMLESQGNSGNAASAAVLNRMMDEKNVGGAGVSRPSRSCLVCRERGHFVWECPKRKSSGCFRCGDRNHVVRECRCPVEFNDPRVNVVYTDSGDDDDDWPPSRSVASRPGTPARSRA
jgi:hypothetical protein